MQTAPALFSPNERISPSHVLLTATAGNHVVSNGTQSYEKVSLIKLVPFWVSLLVGLLGLTHILVVGFVRIAMGRIARSHPLPVPFAVIRSCDFAFIAAVLSTNFPPAR